MTARKVAAVGGERSERMFFVGIYDSIEKAVDSSGVPFDVLIECCDVVEVDGLIYVIS